MLSITFAWKYFLPYFFVFFTLKMRWPNAGERLIYHLHGQKHSFSLCYFYDINFGKSTFHVWSNVASSYQGHEIQSTRNGTKIKAKICESEIWHVIHKHCNRSCRQLQGLPLVRLDACLLHAVVTWPGSYIKNLCILNLRKSVFNIDIRPNERRI